jgi:hypothetical protein
MLDVLIPVSKKLESLANEGCEKQKLIKEIDLVAMAGVIGNKRYDAIKRKISGLSRKSCRSY